MAFYTIPDYHIRSDGIFQITFDFYLNTTTLCALIPYRIIAAYYSCSAYQQNLNLNTPILTISSPDHNHLFIHNSHRIKHHYP